MLLHLAIHYALYLGIVIFGYPEEEVSIGLHERIGPCNQTVPLHTAFGTVSILSLHWLSAFFDKLQMIMITNIGNLQCL